MWFNPLMRWLINSPLHFFVSRNMMLMTYKGRKSGKSYTTPLNYLEIEGALYTISFRKRVWWRNLRAGAAVTLRLRGKDVPARAEVIEDPSQVSNSLQQFLNAAPEYARYLNVQLDGAGSPKSEDLERLTNERVVVLSLLK